MRVGAGRPVSPKRRLRSSRAVLAVTVLAAVTVVALGYFAGDHGKYALVAGSLLLIAAFVVAEPCFLAVVTIPCTLLIVRVGGSNTNLSASDLVLFLGALSAIPLFNLAEASEVKPLLVLDALYQTTTLLAVMDNHYRAAYIEWIHEIFIVSGSLIVGWVVARRGLAKISVGIFVWGAAFIAAFACVWTLSHHLRAAYVLGLQKNYTGVILAYAVIVLYSGNDWLGWRGRRWPRILLIICLLGILATQSRQAMVAIIVGMCVLALRSKAFRRRFRLMLAALVPFGIIAYVTVSKELTSTNRFNSVHQRQTWLHQSIRIWESSPWFGIGLRWWYTNRVANAFQPPNGEAEMLTSAGVVGLAGFLVLLLGVFICLRKVPSQYGTIALAIITMRIAQGQLDLFWVGASGSLPWMLIGVSLGLIALTRARTGQTEQSSTSALLTTVPDGAVPRR